MTLNSREKTVEAKRNETLITPNKTHKEFDDGKYNSNLSRRYL